MPEPIRMESPLARLDLRSMAAPDPDPSATVTARERAFLGHVNLRGKSNDPRFLEAATRALGLDLPLEPNTVAEDDKLVVCWLGPDEWLVLTRGEHEQQIVDSLRDSLAGQFSAVTALSGGQTVIALEGSAARDVLARGCTIDFHPREFSPGCCVQSHFGKAMVLIRQVNETPRFELVVRRSFAEYVWSYLLDAARDEIVAVVD